jgi:ABC-type multidrug transport system ATPase subunit
VVGPAGSGKTTFLKLLAGRHSATCGRIKVLGRSPARSAANGRTGFVPDKTARNGAADSAGWFGWITRLFKTPPPSALPQVAARKPEILIVDNPFSASDDSVNQSSKELLLALQGQGATIIIASRHLEDVKEICHRVAVLHGGKIEAVGPVPELLASPEYLRALVPVLSAPLRQRTLDLIRQDLGLPATSEPSPPVPIKPTTPAKNPSSAEQILSSLVKEPKAPHG